MARHFTDTKREALAEWWRTFDGPAYPSGEEFAEALLASDWLAAQKTAAVEAVLAPVRALADQLDHIEGRASGVKRAVGRRLRAVLPPAPTEGGDF